MTAITAIQPDPAVFLAAIKRLKSRPVCCWAIDEHYMDDCCNVSPPTVENAYFAALMKHPGQGCYWPWWDRQDLGVRVIALQTKRSSLSPHHHAQAIP